MFRSHSAASLGALVLILSLTVQGRQQVGVERPGGVAQSLHHPLMQKVPVLQRVHLQRGLVYVTDVTAAGDAVEGIEFDESAEAVNTYPIVALKDSASADVAQAFVDYVAGQAGQDVLRAAGFGAP